MADQTPLRTGRCLCGAVRYRVQGPLRDIMLCHCSQCRRVSGYLGAYSSASRSAVEVEGADALRWHATSARGRRAFCGICGSSLFYEPAGEERLAIVAGSLDQPSGLRLMGHEYVADKADYVRIDDDLPAFPGDFGVKPDERA
jgi:hypothetical protein